MTYATKITDPHVKARWILKIAGVPYYLSNYGADDGSETYNDSGTHGSLPVYPWLADVSVSPGRLEHGRGLITPSTASCRIFDNSTTRTTLARRTSRQQLVAAATAGASSITVGDTSAWSDGDHIHVNRECMKIDGAPPSGTVANVLRGRLGTTATAHTINASPVSTAPLHWHGRKCWLVLGAQEDSGWIYQETWKVFYVEGSPPITAGGWSLQLSDALTYLDRKFAIGFPWVEVANVKWYTTETRCRLYPADMTSFLSPGSNQNLGVMVRYRGRTGIFLVNTIQATYLEIYPNDRSIIEDENGDYLTFWDFIKDEGDETTNWYMIDAECKAVYAQMAHHGDPEPATIALKVMLSNLGDGSVHAEYDTLPGLALDSLRPQVRSGCGLSTDEVDITSWEDAIGARMPSTGFIVNYKGEESLLDFLTRDIEPLLGGYVYVNSAGKVAFKRYEPSTPVTSASLAITENENIGTDNAVDDELVIPARIKIFTDYSWAQDRFKTIHNGITLEGGLEALYGDNLPHIVFQSRLAGKTHQSVLSVLEQVRSRWAQGGIRYSVVVPHVGALIMPGDTVSYTNPRLPNQTGGQGITAKLCEVVSSHFNLTSGTTTLELIERPSCQMVSPSAELGSNVAGDQWNVTALYTSEALDDEWAVDWVVQFFDMDLDGSEAAATGTLRSVSGVDTSVIAALTSGTMTFTSPPSNIAEGDLITLASYPDVSAVTATNSTAGALPTDYAYITPWDEKPNPTAPAHRWG